jgi:hypothetical protein
MIINNTVTQYETVGLRGYRVTSIVDQLYGLSAFQSNEVSCVWDRIKIIDGGVSSAKTNVTKTVTVWLKVVYEHDNEPFNFGVLYVNGSTMAWSPTNARWEANFSYGMSGGRTFRVSGVSDSRYGLTVLNDTVGALSAVWENYRILVGDEVYEIPTETNSTISSLSYDSSSRELTLIVEGYFGTIGSVNLTIPKELVPEGSTLQVLVDGEPYPFASSENVTCYFIRLTYVHSQHTITVKIIETSEPSIELKFNVHLDDQGYIILDLSINSSAYLSGGLGAYSLNLSASEGITLLGALGGEAPFNSPPTANVIDGRIVVNAFISETHGPQVTDLHIASLILGLNGTANGECVLGVSHLTIVDAGNGTEFDAAVVYEPLVFMRGDANKDGHVSIADAMFVAQYLAGNRPAPDLNLLNAASIKQDDSKGDKVSIADAMFIAQYLAELRDECFNLKG